MSRQNTSRLQQHTYVLFEEYHLSVLFILFCGDQVYLGHYVKCQEELSVSVCVCVCVVRMCVCGGGG